MIILKVKQKGHLLTIPGVAPFRTPATVEITSVKLNMVIASLHNSGISDYEIIAKEDQKEVVYTKKDFELPVKKEQEQSDQDLVGERLDKIEKMLMELAKKERRKSTNKEQTINKLDQLEELSRKILEKESVREIVYTSSKESGEGPIVEDLDDELFVPDIDIADMKLKGSSSEVIGTLDDVDEAADALSQLKR